MVETFKDEVTITEERIYKKVIYCDCCHKEITSYSLDQNGIMRSDQAVYYYQTSTGHYEWGNDSIDSFETSDICSRECLEQVFEHYFDLVKKYPSMFIEVRRVI